MPPLNLTPKELERWSYANGDIATAALCRRIDDGDQVLRETIDSLEDELDEALSLPDDD